MRGELHRAHTNLTRCIASESLSQLTRGASTGASASVECEDGPAGFIWYSGSIKNFSLFSKLEDTWQKTITGNCAMMLTQQDVQLAMRSYYDNNVL